MVWQYFVKNWLRQQAGKTVRDAMTNAATEEETAPKPAEDEAASAPCHVGIVTNNPTETGSILDRLTGVIKTHGHGFKAYEGGLKGRRVIVMQSPAGPTAAAEATRALVQGHEPQWVLAAGFAGGLVPTLVRGDLIVANSVADTSGSRLGIDVKPQSDSRPAEFHVGRVVSTERQPQLPNDKRQLAAVSDAIAADTNSMSVADECRQANVLCLVVRVVRDAVDDQLPSEVQNVIEQKSIAGKLGAATGALINRPSSAKDWWNVKAESLKSADRLAEFLEEMIKQLPPRASSKPPGDD